jgi:hypothetical protein
MQKDGEPGDYQNEKSADEKKMLNPLSEIHPQKDFIVFDE